MQPSSSDATPPRLGKRRKQMHVRVSRAVQPLSPDATPPRLGKRRKQMPARASSAVPGNSALLPVKRPKPRLAAIAVQENSAFPLVKLQKQKLAAISARRANSATPAALLPICSAKDRALQESTGAVPPDSPQIPSVCFARRGCSPAQRAIRSRINARGDVTLASFPIRLGSVLSVSARRAQQ